MSSQKYLVKGTYFEGCNCDYVCPCVFLSDPTHGYCEALVGWHIDEGRIGPVKLDGLNMAVWLRAPENMTKGGWSMAVYVDDRASPEQKQALLEIWSGQHGGHPQVLASLTKEILGVRSAKIEYSGTGKHKTMRVGSQAELEAVPLEGAGGHEVTIHHLPLAVAPSHPSVAHKANRVRFDDFGRSQDVSGTNGFASPFMYSA